MPVKLFPLHLRLLPGAMKPNPVLRGSRVMPVLSRVFPHKLKYHNFGPSHLKKSLLQTQVLNGAQLGVCKFSTRSGQRMQASKSLIEDEAELSDWVSGLSSNSFKKTRTYSDSENDEDNHVENGGYKSRGTGGKRQRGSEVDKDSEFLNRRGGVRSSIERRKTGNAWERRAENDSTSSIGGRGGRGGRGRDSSDSLSRRERGELGASLEEKNQRVWDNKRRDSLFSREGWRENEGRSEKRSELWNEERGRGGRGRDSSDFLSRRERGELGASLEEKNKRAWDNKRRDSLFSREGWKENEGRSEKRSEMWNEERGRKFGGWLEGKSKRNDSLFDSEKDLITSKRWRDNGERREKKPEMWNGRNIGGDHGGLEMKREGKGIRRRSTVLSDDEDKEEEKEKGYTSFKELIDSEEEEEEEEVEVEVAAAVQDGEEEGADGLVGNGGVFSKLEPSSPGKNDSYLSETRFDQCSISPFSLKGIKDAGYERMTCVQEATLPVILKGKDVLAKAKTGTGKTVAFLLPAIELVVQSPPITRDQKRPPILVLVICPTRELASQAAAEANTLLKYHPSIGVQVVIGGTRLPLEQKRMQANPCQILVATPGRLRDHIENTAGFATRLMGVKVLVLDEADHLLDMGFRKEIEKIIAAVPKQRQTLLFSATIPQEVRQICHIALKRDHEFINTVEEGSEDTHSQVRQTHLVTPLDKHFSLLYTLLKEHVADDLNYKILVFCTTAMVTRLVAEFLSELKLNVREIHSRKPQSYRTRISDEFRKSKGLILVTSDVSARGVDYPDVTLVVQIGIPSDRQQYIHRLGRTGRKGKEGQGVLLLAPWEEFFLSGVKDLPISKASEPLVDPETRKKVERALSHVEMKNKESAYQAWLGYYNSNKNIGRDKYKLVELANEFSRSMGLDNPPAIPKLVLGKMGLKNIPGLRSK